MSDFLCPRVALVVESDQTFQTQAAEFVVRYGGFNSAQFLQNSDQAKHVLGSQSFGLIITSEQHKKLVRWVRGKSSLKDSLMIVIGEPPPKDLPELTRFLSEHRVPFIRKSALSPATFTEALQQLMQESP